MIRLTLAQLTGAVQAAHQAREAAALKDTIGSREEFTARLSLPAPMKATLSDPLAQAHHTFVDVKVPRATLLAEANDRMDAALDFLKALGIDFDPAG